MERRAIPKNSKGAGAPMSQHGLFSRARGILVLTVAALASLSVSPFRRDLRAQAPQSSAHKSEKANPPARLSPKQVPVPFQEGEHLEYRVGWAAFATAAAVELSIPERRDLYGWHTWHFRASARTVGPVHALFPIDDQFDSYTDALTLESRQYETYLEEMGRKQDQQWTFLPEGQTPRAPGAAVIVLLGTRDPLGALYALRSADWQRMREMRAPVFDGRQLYEMRARTEASAEAVEVPAGKYSATHIAIHVFENKKELSGIDFAVWLARDPARTPVLMSAELPFGTLRVELTSPLR
jgi:Protein of unknown function (DUF3108)